MRYIMVHNGIEPVPDGILQRFPQSQQSNEYNECLSGKFLTKYLHYWETLVMGASLYIFPIGL